MARVITVDSQDAVIVAGTSGSGSDCVTVKYSAEGVPLWTNRYPFTGPRAVATSPAGDVYVAGFSPPTPGQSQPDLVLLAYTSGGIPISTNRFVGLVTATPTSYRPDVFIATNGTAFLAGDWNFGAPNYKDAVTAACAANGQVLWTNYYNHISGLNSIQNDYGMAVTLGGDGRVFVTGKSFGVGRHDIATIAYSNSGIALWTNRYVGTYDSEPRAIVTDVGGNVYVAGSTIQQNAAENFVTLACASDGTPLWTNIYVGTKPGPDVAQAIATDARSNVFVTGFSTGIYSTSPGYGYDYATLAYSPSGIPLWTNRYTIAGNYEDVSTAIAVDRNGNVFVTGYSSSGTNYDYATIAYAGDGTPVWTNRYNGPANSGDYATGIAIDNSNNVIVTGYSISSFGGNDFLTIKYAALPPIAHLGMQLQPNQIVLTWTNVGFQLQSAPSVAGVFTNVAGATSPYTNLLNASQQFFRLIGN